MYAVGWTMHTVGSQIIRTGAILQLLLGNIGRPGGGINALRGHANVQGATDHAIVAGARERTERRHLTRVRPEHTLEPSERLRRGATEDGILV